MPAVKLKEAEFQKMVIDLARLYRWKVAHFRRVRVQRGNSTFWETPVAADGKGFPDLVLVRRDRLLFIELKVGANKQTPEQEEWEAALSHHFYVVLRPEDWDDIVEMLK